MAVVVSANANRVAGKRRRGRCEATRGNISGGILRMADMLADSVFDDKAVAVEKFEHG